MNKNALNILCTRKVWYILVLVGLLVSCKKNNASGPTANAITPDSAAGNAVITLTGSGLSNIQSILFDNGNVPAPFNPVFNTSGAIIFRVPDTANGGAQNIILTNAAGQSVKVAFKVIALATISSASINGYTGFEFYGGTQLTLTGNNLDNVTNVVIDGTSDKATIVSATKHTLVLTMPTSSVTSAKLDITNGSGTVVTQQSFVDVDNAFQWFAKNSYGPGVQDWSWDNSSVDSGVSILGSKSLLEKYSSGSWSALSFHAASPVPASNYTQYSFWVKGGAVSEQVDISSEDGGSTLTITVPPSVWTYFTVPINGFINGVNVNRMDFKMHGPNNTDSVYYDELIFSK
jgi:IPT/TIG domain